MTGQIHILYVDDDPLLLDIAKQFLEQENGWTVTTAESAADAIHLHTKKPFNAIVSDYEMEQMDGIALLKYIRGMEDTTPFIIFTGKGREEVVIEALNNGADFYLQKGGLPSTQFAELSNKILYAISRRRAESDLLRQNEELTRQEHIIQKSEKQFKSLYMHMIEGAALHDLIYNDQGDPEDYVITKTNPAFEKQLGISSDLVIGKTSREAYGVSDPPYFDIYARVALTGEPETFETFYPPMQKYFSISVYCPYKGSFATVFEDITDRKNREYSLLRKNEELQAAYEEISATEEELRSNLDEISRQKAIIRANENRLLMAQEISRTGCWEYSLETNKIWGSAEGLHIFGYPPVAGDFPIDKIEACIPERDRVHQALVDLLTLEAEYNLEYAIYPADGSPQKFVHSVARLEKDAQGGLIRVMGIIQDVTERKHAEDDRNRLIAELRDSNEEISATYEELLGTEQELKAQYTALASSDENLRQTKDYLENLITNANVPIIVWDPTFRITRLNHAFELLIGRYADEVIGTPLEFLFPPDQVDRSMRLIRTTQEGVRWKTVEMDIMHQDGSLRTLLWNSSTLYTPDGATPVATIAQGHDITTQRSTELEKNVAIEQVKQNLAQLSILNDEIRNPLTVITLYADNIRDSAIADQILTQTQHIDEMVHQLDTRWIESEKVLGFLQRHYQISFDHGISKHIPGESVPISPRDIDRNDAVLIQEVQAELYTILDSIDALVYVADMETHELLFMNRQGRCLFGDVIGKKCYETIQQGQDEPCPFCTNSLLIDTKGPTGVYQWEYQNPKTGRWYDCRDQAIRWVDGRIVRIEIATDITRLKQSLEELRTSEETKKLTLEAINDGVWDWDIISGTTSFNPRYYTMLGYEPGEFPATFEAWKDQIHPDDQERIVLELIGQIKDKQDFPRIEYRIRTKNGEYIWILGRGKPVAFDELGNITRIIGSNTDITQLKQIEESLGESRDRYWKLIQNIPDYILVHRNGIILFVNAAAATSLGYSQKELIGSDMTRYLTPESQSVVIEMMQRRVSGDTFPPYDITLITKDGRQKITEVNGVLIQYEGGPASLNVLTDVTEKRHTLEELRESESRFRSLLQYVPSISVQGYNMDGTIQYWNEASESLYGYSATEAIGKNLLDLIIPPEMQEDVREAMKYMRDTGKTIPASELLLMKKDGTRVAVFSSHAVVKRSGGEDELFCLDIDLSDQKKVEEQLRELTSTLAESEEKYRSLIENTHDLIYTINTEGILTFVSFSWTTLLGHPTSEIIGQSFQNFVHPDDIPGCMVFLRSVIETGERQKGVEYRVQHINGTWHWHTSSAVPIKNESKTVVGFYGIAHDMTDRKKAEEALYESNQKLRLLNGLTRHDANNQITALQLILDLASNTEDLSEIKGYISKAQKTGDQIDRTIGFTRQYESFGVVSSGWQRIVPIIGAAQAEVILGDVTIYNQIPKDLEIYADPIIRKVFTTLIENAIRHGGEVTRIQFFCHELEDAFIIICEDDGTGVPEEEKNRIFDHGYGKHTGIGLYIAREILSITGLSIRECGVPGEGARFEIPVPTGKYRFL